MSPQNSSPNPALKISLFIVLSLVILNRVQASGDKDCFDGKMRCLSCNMTKCNVCYYGQITLQNVTVNGTVKAVTGCTENKNTIEHCMMETKVLDKIECGQCDNGYYFSNQEKKCLKGNLANCMSYSPDNKDSQICNACGNKHYLWTEVDQTTKKTTKSECRAVAADKVIPDCTIHHVMEVDLNGEKKQKTVCALCEEGFALNTEFRCAKECTKGCAGCNNDGKCEQCDMFRMQFMQKSGECKYIAAPEGSYNSFPIASVKEIKTSSILTLTFLLAFSIINF